jgi:hypothetical protein
MNPQGSRSSSYLLFAVALASVAVLGGSGLALWQNQGPSLFLTLSQNGLPFCF